MLSDNALFFLSYLKRERVESIGMHKNENMWKMIARWLVATINVPSSYTVECKVPRLTINLVVQWLLLLEILSFLVDFDANLVITSLTTSALHRAGAIRRR